MASSESLAHLKLKRLSLIWAQANGYPIASTEVSLPNLRFRLDAAAYRPGSVRLLKYDETRRVNRYVTSPTIGIAAAFECKANRADLLRDCRHSVQLLEKIQVLEETRVQHEARLRIQSPSLLKGDALWPEYETVAFEAVSDIEYLKTLRILKTLRLQVHGQTKMENLMKWNAANLHYLVVEAGIVKDHEIPWGWGLLVRNGEQLELQRLPEFQDIPEESRLSFLHRIAAAGTKSSNREFGITYGNVEMERRGIANQQLPDEPK